MRLPNAVIIGAPRSGTTTLFHHLGNHPDVFVPATKEVHFFDSNFERGVSWYAEHLDPADEQRVLLEATPMYMSNAVAMQRLGDTIPDATLVAILRDPCERARSHFHYRVARGLDSGTLEDALDRENAGEREAFPYLRIGMYHRHLTRLERTSHRGRVLVLWQDDLRDRPVVVRQQLSDALGVDLTRADWGSTTVNTADHFRSVGLRRWARKRHPMIRRVVGRVNRIEVEYPALSLAVRGRMLDALSTDIEALARRTVRDLTHWLTVSPS